MTEPALLTQAEDDRQRAVIREALDETLFVAAGAGTGKTRALVDRFLALVLAGRPIDRIVAITFTEKAAAELRDRVRAGLEETQAENAEQQELITAALASLDRAEISTIHAFGRGLLRFFAAEAGIDPAFIVLDELQAERRLQERWHSYLEELAADQTAVSAIDRAMALGLTTGDIGKLARELAGGAELLDLLEGSLPEPPAPDWPDLAQAQGTLEELLPLGPADDRLRAHLDELLSLVRRLAKEGADREALLASGAAVLGKSVKVGRQDDWGGKEGIQHVRETASTIATQLEEALAACRTKALANLLPFVVRFVREEIEARGKEGMLTFDDLILRVHELLRTNDVAVRTLRERYDALLIDEFQDTDPRQADIALAFATDPETGRLEPGRLFLVGDPKQSIYRFRGADMAIYSRTRDLLEEQGGRFPSLSFNQRSRETVLEWVNHVFAGVIGTGADTAVQPPYVAIHSERSGELAGPGVAWVGDEVTGMLARDVRQLEAQSVAQRCRAVLEEGWQVTERDGTVRLARLGDIAILIPTRGILAPLERAFANVGVAFRVEGGSLLYRTQEIRDIINCLAAIDDPADEVAIVGALRSPAFACSDVDLARHRAVGGRFNYLARDLDGQEGRVAESLQVLQSFHLVRHDSSLAALVERFVAERGLVEVGVLDQADRNSFRRMRFMVEQARAFEANGPESLRAFAGWMEQRANQAIPDHEGGSLDDDEDAVRVLTIHGAKGLEFPIVFLAGLGAKPRNQPPTYGADYANSRVAVAIGPKSGAKSRRARFELGPVDEIHALEEAHTKAEAARLLYVAATRARDHLVVSLYHTTRAKGSWARLLIEHGAREHASPLPELQPRERLRAAPFADLEVEPLERPSEASFLQARSDLFDTAQRQRYTSATALGRKPKDETTDESERPKEERTDESEPWARGRGATRLGRAVHAAIQSLPWDADEALIDAFARAQAVAEAIPDRSSEVADLVRRALQSDAAGRARSAERALREVPFALPRNGTILEGFVDLIIETESGIEIVDWKTDNVSKAEIAERLKEYELQAGLYVLGIEEATQKTVRRVTYVFVRAGVEQSPGDPASLRASALARLDEEARGVERE